MTRAPLTFADFWYVVAVSDRLTPGQVMSCTVRDEWLAVFRDRTGQPVAFRDRCMHRHSRLSQGQVHQGELHCPYHGWVYDAQGQVVAVPSEGNRFQFSRARCAKSYPTREQNGYIYVCLGRPRPALPPYALPHQGEPGWATVRVVNRFENSVTNCVENFIDIPHTVSVHPGIFRQARRQELAMTVVREAGKVTATYRQETNNLGWFSRFLNPDGQTIQHCDRFIMPNITSVDYHMGDRRQLWITSQAVPETPTQTVVYTDVAFNYGGWTQFARPLVYWTTQKIIGQDIRALKIQQEVIAKYGQQFANTPADRIHEWVESIHRELEQGRDPRDLATQSAEITFWV